MTTPDGGSVTVQYFKYPRIRHWRHDLIRLGQDEHGTWLGAAPGFVIQRGAEPPIPMTRPFVQLVPPSRPWSALFNDPGHRIAIYVDVTTPATWVGPGRVELIDLDLDVIKRNDGSVYVDDEDEFEKHRITLGYPPAMADAARSAAARLVIALEDRVAPFDDTAAAWLERLAGS